MFRELINKPVVLLICIQLCFGILGAFVFNIVMDRYPKQIATVNITGLIDSFVKETSKQPLSTEEMKQKVNGFTSRLNNAVVQIAKQKNLVLLPSEAIIAGSPDLTFLVAEIVKKESKS